LGLPLSRFIVLFTPFHGFIRDKLNKHRTRSIKKEFTMSKFHCAVNFVSGSTVLVRVKELGSSGLTMKANAKAWGDSSPVKGENFLAEISDDVIKVGNYLIPADFKVVSREFSEAPVPMKLSAIEVEDESAPFPTDIDF
jgi:hypothetical protein